MGAPSAGLREGRNLLHFCTYRAKMHVSPTRYPPLEFPVLFRFSPTLGPVSLCCEPTWVVPHVNHRKVHVSCLVGVRYTLGPFPLWCEPAEKISSTTHRCNLSTLLSIGRSAGCSLLSKEKLNRTNMQENKSNKHASIERSIFFKDFFKT